MRIRTRLAVMALAGVIACGTGYCQSSTGQSNTGQSDTGQSDTGQSDTGQSDTGRSNSGGSDAGQTDASRTEEARAEKELFAAVNEARRNQARLPLRWNDALAAAARRHAAAMAEHRVAQHGFEGEPSLSVRVKQTGTHFMWLSENVTQGPKAELIHAQFMKSPNHRVNILDADMNSIGVGVVEQDGQLFAVEDFADLR